MSKIQQFRQWSADNSRIVISVCTVVIILSLLLMGWQMRPVSGGPLPELAWYYDVETKKTFTDSSKLIPPIKSPEGNQSVLVYFYACGECSPDNRFVGFYEKYSEDDKKAIETSGLDMQHLAEGSTHESLISQDGSEWFPSGSAEAMAIRKKIDERCKNMPPTYCTP